MKMKGQGTGFNFGFLVSGVILFAVGILVATALLPEIMSQTSGINTSASNVSGATKTVVDVLPIIYVVVPIVLGISFLVKALKA